MYCRSDDAFESSWTPFDRFQFGVLSSISFRFLASLVRFFFCHSHFGWRCTILHRPRTSRVLYASFLAAVAAHFYFFFRFGYFVCLVRGIFILSMCLAKVSFARHFSVNIIFRACIVCSAGSNFSIFSFCVIFVLLVQFRYNFFIYFWAKGVSFSIIISFGFFLFVTLYRSSIVYIGDSIFTWILSNLSPFQFQ